MNDEQTTKDEKTTKIDAGVREARHFGDSSDLPFTRLAAYIRRLRAHPNWSDMEINEVRRRAVRELLVHRNQLPGAWPGEVRRGK